MSSNLPGTTEDSIGYIKLNMGSIAVLFCFAILGDSAAFFLSKTPVVAFTALLSTDTTVGGGAIVKYDHVITNWGGAYQPATGIFTAPFDGLYSFSCSVMSYPSNSIHLNMVKNRKRMSVLYSAASTFPQSSQTLYLVLNKGDRIWMQNAGSSAAKLHDLKVYNAFSGALIKDM